MTNLTNSLELHLKGPTNDPNSQKPRLKLNAEKDSYLRLDENSKGSVDYAAKGCGGIAAKVATISRKLHTAQSVKDFEMDKQLLKSADWGVLDKGFNNILI